MNQFEKPFPHTVIDGFLSPEVVARINDEWPEGSWSKKAGKTSVKWNTQDLPPAAREVVEGIDISLIERVTGIQGLIADPDLFGGGLHCIPSGGYLKMHVDFNKHPKGWHRRVNLIIFLNEHWEDMWGGHLRLELGDQEKYISPVGGRAVIFETTDSSWHGHPDPLGCPVGVQRRSLALYFYTEQPPATPSHTTIYRRD